MTQVTKYPKFVLFARKLIVFRDGALVFIAAPGSISLTGILDAVIENTSIKALVLPLLVAAVSLFLYFITFLLDLISGIKASSSEAKPGETYFTSIKGWNSIWKISVVVILVIGSSFFSMLSALAGINYLANFFLFVVGIVATMAILLDIYSIGENQKRISGHKSRIFVWLDQITNLINELITNRIKNLFR